MIYTLKDIKTQKTIQKSFSCHEEAERYVESNMHYDLSEYEVTPTQKSDFTSFVEFPWRKSLPTVTGR